jgi:DNA polymerase III epsilon subunit-like protein
MRIGYTRKRKQRGLGKTRSRSSSRSRSRSKSPVALPEPVKKPFSMRRNAPVFVPSSVAVAARMANEAASFTPVNVKNNNRADTRADILVNSVALDCEMVGVGPGDKSALGQIAICDFWGNQIYNEYVIPREGIKAISNYRTKYSGITKEMLVDKGRKFNEVIREVKALIKDRIVVGHGLDSDFTVLEFKPAEDMIWDTAKIPKYQKPHPYRDNIKQPRKLKDLARNFTGNNIQKDEKNEAGRPKGHSPLEDARAAMNLYRVHNHIGKVSFANMSDPNSMKDDPYFNKLFEMAMESMRK